MAIVFKKTGMNDLTIENGRLFPISNKIQINQKRYLTQGMNPKVVVYSGTLKFIQLRFQGLDRDNYDGQINGLKTWFENSNINWSENSFTLEDEEGNTHTVRYWNDTFDMPEVENNYYSCDLTLLLEG